MLENAAESHQSSARFVGQFYVVQDSLPEKSHCDELDEIIVNDHGFYNRPK